MIDKNFYLENLSAFDILIQDEDHEKAKQVIFRVYSILQRDKIWLKEVAAEEEIFEDEVELLDEVEEELTELDLKYDFGFKNFHELVQAEMKKRQMGSDLNSAEIVGYDDDFAHNLDYSDDDEMEEELNVDDEDGEEDDFEEIEDNLLTDISDEELDQITGYILERAKTRFDYAEFLESFDEVEDDFVDTEIIFPIIVGKSEGEIDEEIAGEIMTSLLTIGFFIDIEEVANLVAQKGKELGLEVLAFTFASDSLQKGVAPNEVLSNIMQLLRD